MKKALVVLAASLMSALALAQDGGLVTRQSKYSVAETAARLDAAIKSSGIYKVFFRLDHAANAAEEAGVKIPPSQLILFGNPKGGAPLLQASATLGIDLPNRALIWEDASGKVWVTYNEIRTLFNRHGIKRTNEQIKAIEYRQKALFDKAAD
ncbi:MAG: DUF302 domain-containing protein [Burkholderiaceae bacterium]